MASVIPFLIEQLDRELEKRGFAIEKYNTYGNPVGGRYYRWKSNPDLRMDCIVNKNSILFYFMPSLLKNRSALEQLIIQLDNGLIAYPKGGPSYRYRIKTAANLQTLFNFIDEHILSPTSRTQINVNITEQDIESTRLTLDIADKTFDEGARKQVVSVAIERNRQARTACLTIHGSSCKACGVILAERYAGIEKDIIHVHHLILVSDHPGEYRIDPRNDLVPVCPNCHSVIHSKHPPYTIAEIKAMLIQDHF
ncbi:HNH endonuclease [Methylomagnum sp.]